MKAKKILKIVLCILLVIVLVVGDYVAYVFLSWSRIPDNQELTVSRSSNRNAGTGETYRILSWNIGFGAYEDDYGFFMDGGTQSWAWSEERLNANLENIAQFLSARNADFLLIQEIDTDSTRSYHVNELRLLSDRLHADHSYDTVFAQNYNSPFLFYPILQPHGASKAGIGTFSDYTIRSALRRSLPIEEGLTKVLDLDRCYSVSRLELEGGHELCLYNLHLSAYTSDGSIANEQLKLLLNDMQGEYEKGNYCVAGGDFNKDILGDSSVYFGKSDIEYTWAQPIPEEVFDGVDITLVAPLDVARPVPSCRNADGPYHEGQYVLTVDGFLVSPNVEVRSANVVNLQFKYSDHNPVYMEFVLTA